MIEKDDLTPIHPGEVLAEDVLEAFGMSVRELSREIGVSPNRISAITRGERAISADTALRLARWLGTSPEIWLKLQMRYNIEMTQRASGDQIRKEVQPRAASKSKLERVPMSV